MPAKGSTTQRGYGYAYQQARKRLLADNPKCAWCGNPATTADHDPPLAEVGHPHLNLVPACRSCQNLPSDKKVRHRPSRQW